MTNKNCLNCEKKITDKFCAGCGQKTDTQRITLRKFILHDVLHGTFHFDKGIFFTAKQALLRPGKAALDYIAGKRIIYYNVFYLILITIGLMLFIRHFYGQLEISLGRTIDVPKKLDEASIKFNYLLSQKSKIIIFLFVPFAALNSYILFRRKKYNLSEHAILAGMLLLGMLLISLCGHIIFYLDLIVNSDVLTTTIDFATPILIIFYLIYGYYNAFNAEYTKLGLTSRIILFFAMLSFEITGLLLILIGFATNWKFGKITLSI